MQSELMVPHECQRCGLVDEAKFVYSGPHIKQVCNGCGSYVKFFHKNAIPDVKEIKLRIWSITQDLDKINQAKINSNYVENLEGLNAKMIYWRLYLQIRSDISKMEVAQ